MDYFVAMGALMKARSSGRPNSQTSTWNFTTGPEKGIRRLALRLDAILEDLPALRGDDRPTCSSPLRQRPRCETLKRAAQ